MENRKKISKLTYVIIALVLVAAAVFAVVGFKTGIFTKNNVNEEVLTTYSLSVTAQGEEIFDGEVKSAEGTTLMDSMVPALKAEGIEVVSESGDYGAFITAIGGHEQNYSENLYWSFKVNDELVMEGASTFVPKEGDKVAFTLEVIEW